VGQFDQSDNGDCDLCIARWARDGCEHLSHILTLAFGCNQDA